MREPEVLGRDPVLGRRQGFGPGNCGKNRGALNQVIITVVFVYLLNCVSLFCPWYSLAKILEWVAISFSRGLSPPRDHPTSPATAGRFFTTEPPAKSSNLGVRAKLDHWQGWSHTDLQPPRSAQSLWPEGAAPSSRWELSK